ncbi:MAG: glycerol kinase [Cycloclasticus sp.]|nr:glycerol kinase [Cycloclasticus sp.]MBG95972.1 glycerol kinase [Cycloclasticus sp.]HAI97343.1 glycerol kinase [Methylococcaceae bacterium]
MLKAELVSKEDGTWVLTDKGKALGGDYKESKKYGKYVVWPEEMRLDSSSPASQETTEKSITATVIGKYFELSANKVNFIFSEIGWIDKGLKGWNITVQGKKQGGVQAENFRTGIPYVRWPESILKSKTLLETVSHVKGTAEIKLNSNDKEDTKAVGFREKFLAKHRSADGHFVRSKAEMLIDNWLYMAEIVHAYERKLPIEEDVYCDFYIPTGKVYIEYWGYENDQKYLARKEKKIDIYKKYGFNLIELNDEDVQNLDDLLPKMLLKYGVQAY